VHGVVFDIFGQKFLFPFCSKQFIHSFCCTGGFDHSVALRGANRFFEGCNARRAGFVCKFRLFETWLFEK